MPSMLVTHEQQRKQVGERIQRRRHGRTSRAMLRYLENGRPVVLQADHRPVVRLRPVERALGAPDIVELAVGVVV